MNGGLTSTFFFEENGINGKYSATFTIPANGMNVISICSEFIGKVYQSV
jgi:hypothetical protein